MITELIGRVFATRNIAHLQHWTIKSYAQHQALGEFYSGIIDAIDDIAECYIGQFGVFGDVEFPTPEVTDLIDYLREEADWIETNRDAISEESNHIGNLIDNLVAIYTKTIYKLERLS